MPYTRRTKRLILGFATLLLVLGFIIIGSMRWQDAQKAKKRYEEERSNLQVAPPNRHVVRKGESAQLRRYTAVLRPWIEAEVPAEVAGRVLEVLVEPGDQVEAGQVIARLEDQLARIAVDLAQARLDEQQRLLAEANRLVKSRAISETQFQSVAAEVRVATALLAEAKERLKRHTIRAPFAGVINARLVDVGDSINQYEPAAELLDLTRLRVEFFVSERDISAFPRGRQLALFLPYLPQEEFAPKVDFTSRAADPGTRLFRVEATLPNTDLRLPGGLQGIIEAEVARFTDAVLVPTMAVRFRGRQAEVLRETSSGRRETVPVEVGPEIEGFYPVLRGLEAGDVLLIE
jgi:membrane fusion protein (multidrug efflux system)